MTKRTILLILLMIAFGTFIPVNSQAGSTYNIHIDWEYPGSVSNLAGFRLYKEGIQVYEVSNPGARSMDCPVEVNTDQTSFTITAYLSDGTESAHSSPYPFDVGAGNTVPNPPPGFGIVN